MAACSGDSKFSNLATFAALPITEDSAIPKLFTLVVVQQGDRVLLGEKKRGFGEGYYNGFGGKVEKAETILEAAKRELTEEAGISARELSPRGKLTFIFDDRPQPWEVHVFLCTKYDGNVQESEEMRPEWFDCCNLPFSQMWADDKILVPAPLCRQALRWKVLFSQHTHSCAARLEGC
eukprot:jgi/Botrbrau1/459/Bobra.110_2s0104.1